MSVEGVADDMPLVSIIVPAFNAAGYLDESIPRLLAQTFASTEIVVVDDGSTDATAEVASRLAAQHPKIRFFRLAKNGGVARAREHAVRNSRGEYVWFVDADDAPATTALDRLVASAHATGADVVVCSAEFVYRDGRTRLLPAPVLAAPISGRQAFRLLLEGELTGHLWNKLFRRDAALRIEFTPARVHSDLAMVAQLLAAASRVTSIPDNLYSYLLRGGSIIGSELRRAESLRAVEEAVERAAVKLDPRIIRSLSYRYFLLRFVILSGIKDALLGPYDADERNRMIAGLRARLSWRSILQVAARFDGKRLALAVSAKLCLPLHRRILGAARAAHTGA